MSLEQHAQALQGTLHTAKLVPGPAASLIPTGFTPTTRLGVAFNGRPVELGNLFRASECKAPPAISFGAELDSSNNANANANASYLLLLVDPDAPTPDDPKFAFWRHWVLPGLQPAGEAAAAAAAAAATETKPALTEYLGPGPKDEYVVLYGTV